MSNGLLSYEELLALVARGVIRNVDLENINASSIDITLGAKVLAEITSRADPGYAPVLSLKERTPMNVVAMDCIKGFRLQPGQFILAQSEQEFHLPDDISAEYKLKSSMARIGLNHATAGWCDSGWNGSVLTLELKNWSQFHTIEIKKGDKIGQMIFFHHRKVPAEKSYTTRGRYNGDKEVRGIKK